MSRRNSRDAKAARRSQQPQATVPSMGRIADAVHEAVCIATGSDGFTHCCLYAWTGSLVLSLLTGATYGLQAGNAGVFVSDSDPELYVGWQADEVNEEALEFHAWIARMPEDGSPYVQHMVDFTLRHWQGMAACAGLQWDRASLPDWYAGSYEQARETLRVRYAVREEIQRLVERRLATPVMKGAAQDATAMALALLGRLNRAQAMRMLTPEGQARWIAHLTGAQLVMTRAHI